MNPFLSFLIVAVLAGLFGFLMTLIFPFPISLIVSMGGGFCIGFFGMAYLMNGSF